MTNCIVESSGYYGIQIGSTSPKLRGNRIQSNYKSGIYIVGNSSPDLGLVADQGRNTIRNNDLAGPEYQVYNAGPNTVDAYYNFWGHTVLQDIDQRLYDDEERGNAAYEVFCEPFLNNDQALPVTLVSFASAVGADGVLLTWRTATEVGNLGFAVCRSEHREGGYTQIAMLKGAGDSAGYSEYTFVDDQAIPGRIYYYYLESIDLTGERDRSDVILVRFEQKELTMQEQLPTQTALLNNYPNPFNPDTWIPYRLKDVATVVVTIYDIHGTVIRRLELGNKEPGHYTSTSKAARWDGRNDAGQVVSSGVYFYQLQADEFRAMGRMLLRK